MWRKMSLGGEGGPYIAASTEKFFYLKMCRGRRRQPYPYIRFS